MIMLRMPALDRRTRYQGVYARHQNTCRIQRSGRCNCRPSYYGMVYDRAESKNVRTARFATVEAARNARVDLVARLERGEAPAANRGLRLSEARVQFVKAAREGRALNKRGRRYKPSAIDNIEISLRVHAEPLLGRKRITDIRRGEVQKLVDELTPVRSGSRVRSVVNSLRALYRWAQDRELASHDPAQHVRLPAMDPTPIERVASPAEFTALLAALETTDALAYALAAYGMGRASQIRRLRWREVDLDAGLIEWGVEWEARKYDASHRVVPTVPALLALLKRAYLEQGRPGGEQPVCPPRYRAESGLMSTGGLAKRARRRWQQAGLMAITLQECRHTAASWLDGAGVSPKVASVLMGHQTPERQQGAATITLARYTHALPQDIERARERLASYLTEHQTVHQTG